MARLDPGRRQEPGEDVELGALDRVVQERLLGEILGLDPVALSQPVAFGADEHRLIVEQRLEGDAGQLHRVRGDDEIDFLAPERLDRVEGEAHADVDVDIGPGGAELLQHREQPVETGVALDGDVQPAGPSRLHRAELLLDRRHLGQHPLGEAQELQARGRKLHRLGAAVEQLHADLVLQRLDLVGERRLGDVQDVRRPGETAGLMDGADGTQVAKLEIHE